MAPFRRPASRHSALRLGLAALLSVTAGGVSAEGVRAVGYGIADTYGGGYGFADEAVRGAYIGAPFTSVPSPNRIVPAPWSYGTYGVPTLSGIRPAPVAAPSLTVINPAPRPASRRSAGPRILSRDGRDGSLPNGPEVQGGYGPHVVAVTVPRR